MSYPHKCVLLVGATSGIGLAMAERFVSAGSKVIVVGRRKDRLDAFVAKHGSDKADAMVFDATDASGMAKFAETVTKKHPDLDCVFLNQGVSRNHDFSQAGKDYDLKTFHEQVELNFTSYVNLTYAFLPLLRAKKTETTLTYTGSLISIVPATTLPAYCASKAALNCFIMSVREQLQQAKSTVKVVELFPPPVQTELHDATMGIERGRQFGMPADEFAKQAYDGLVAGSAQVIIGSIGDKQVFTDLVDTRMKLFDGLSVMMRAH